MKNQILLFITNHKCKLCICTYCFDRDICKFKYYRCNYVCNYRPHLSCGSKEYFGIYSCNKNGGINYDIR